MTKKKKFTQEEDDILIENYFRGYIYYIIYLINEYY